MYLVAIGWLYVALMMAIAEAISPRGTVLGALVTFALYGVAPTALLMYLLGTPGVLQHMGLNLNTTDGRVPVTSACLCHLVQAAGDDGEPVAEAPHRALHPALPCMHPFNSRAPF